MDNINVALVSDFAYPFLGGVEIHILNLAQQLLTKVNKVIIITHHCPGYVGIKYYQGIKFYYLKLPYHKNLNVIYGTYCLNHFLLKSIFQQQEVNLIHGHSSVSPLSQQAVLCGGVLGIRVITTQHSLYSLKRMYDIHTTKCIQILTVFSNRVICVSRTTRSNFFLRTQTQTQKLIVIPNAAEIPKIKQKKQYNPQNSIKIIFVGRLTYRRGVDLLIDVLEDFLYKQPSAEIIIIGQGVKMPILKRFIQQKQLTPRVQILGAVQNKKVIQIMQGCDIFLNTPLTQSFGIALVQAALEGLLCVSTQVGGVPQVLPKSMLITTQPTKNGVMKGLFQAINRIKHKTNKQSSDQLTQIRNYNWENISNRVLDVYKQVLTSEGPISRKEVCIKIAKKKKIAGYFILLLYLIICLINDIHDWYRKKDLRKINEKNK